MNLNSYDNIKEKVNKHKTWIDINRKQLISREIKYRKYVSLLHRYNPKLDTYSYFIALLDYPIQDKFYTIINRDNYGRIKINLKEIWNNTCLKEFDRDCNIECTLVESEVDGEIYFLDI